MDGAATALGASKAALLTDSASAALLSDRSKAGHCYLPHPVKQPTEDLHQSHVMHLMTLW